VDKFVDRQTVGYIHVDYWITDLLFTERDRNRLHSTQTGFQRHVSSCCCVKKYHSWNALAKIYNIL